MKVYLTNKQMFTLKYHPQFYQRIKIKHVINMNNHNTSTSNTNKLDLDNGYNRQQIETPSISKIPPQDEPSPLSGFLFHSCWRNPSLLIVQQCQSLATWLQLGPIASSRSSCQCLFGWPLGHLWSCGHHSVTHLVHLLSFNHETCPVHWHLVVQIWWITSMTPVFEQIQLALFLPCGISPIIIHSTLHCVVTCDHFLQLCFAEGLCFTPIHDYWEHAFILHFHFQPNES